MPGRRCPVPAGRRPGPRLRTAARRAGSGLKQSREHRRQFGRCVGRHVGSGDLGQVHSTPSAPDRLGVQRRARRRGSHHDPVDPDPGARGRPGRGRRRRARAVSGSCGPQVARPATTGASAGGERRVDVGGTQSAGSRLVNSEPGASTIWSAARDRGGDGRAATGRRAGRARPGGSGRASSGPRPGPRPRRRRPSALRTTGSDVAGRTRPTAPSARPAIVERRLPVAGDLGEADEHEVAERVTFELAGARSGARTLAAHSLVVVAVGRERDQALAQVARRRARRGRAAAGRWSRRRRRRSRPR